MPKQKLSAELRKLINKVTNKRPRTVIEHIRKHGQITTEELKTLYGYNHPPRAARDVREQGVPLETFRIKDTAGRSIAAYRFGDPSGVQRGKLGGRNAFPKALKSRLLDSANGKCAICLEDCESRYLQIDERVPYEVAGPVGVSVADAISYMLLCRSCNRAKSWSCEHCANWKAKSVADCQACYWSDPDDYTHVAMEQKRRLDVVWSGEEANDHEELRKRAQSAGQAMPDYVKAALKRHLDGLS